jgi:hypothetical protein
MSGPFEGPVPGAPAIVGVPERGLPGIGGNAGLALGASQPLELDEVKRLFPEAREVTLASLPPNGGWQEFNISVPTAILPLGWNSPDGSDIGVGVETSLRYNPRKIPDDDPLTGFPVCQQSAAQGIAFLDSPGRWWVSSDFQRQLQVLVIPAYNLGTLATLLQLTGANRVQQVAHGNLPVDPAPALTVAGANLYRRSITLQNTSPGAVNLRVTFINIHITATQWPSFTSVPPRGFLLAPGGFISLSGPTLSSQSVNVRASAAGGVIEVMEED